MKLVKSGDNLEGELHELDDAGDDADRSKPLSHCGNAARLIA
jgi:hypothetical protein